MARRRADADPKEAALRQGRCLNTHPPPGAKASGYTHRRHHPRPCPLSVREPVPGPAHSPRPPGPADPQYRMQTLVVTSVFADQAASEAISAEAGRCPDPAHA